MKCRLLVFLLIISLIFPAGCADTALPDSSGARATGEPVDTLETIEFTRVCNGFLLQPEENRAISISTGIPVAVPMNRTQTVFLHNGTEIMLDFSWAQYENKLTSISHSGSYSVEPVKDSDQFLVVSLDLGYPCLFDIKTQEIIDPLAVLDDTIIARLGTVSFSSDAQYAVIQYDGGTACVLLNCTTGQLIELPYDPDVYAISGFFLNTSSIVLCSAYEADADNEILFSLAHYDLAAKKLMEIPGQYTAKDKRAQGFLVICDDAFGYSCEDGYLVLIDLMTWEKAHTRLLYDVVENVFYCTDSLTGVVYDGIVYIVDREGNAHAVCKTEA